MSSSKTPSFPSGFRKQRPILMATRFSKVNEESPDIDGGSGGNKSIQKKRKLTNMLGSQWSKEELKRFYTAFRKYGKDWKKVAAVVGNRSTEMVEALYHINRAYLSLPDGMASVAGLTAMMDDLPLQHSGVDGSESDDDPAVSQKQAKRACGQYRGNKSRQSTGKLTDMLGSPRSNEELKLIDLLGPQWSNEELKRFYMAFRKYEKDWKKVAGVVRNRSTEMVEALYHINRAYLSLPEGIASVAGLIAMMTDYYIILDRSESDRKSDDAPAVSQKQAA